MSIQTRLSLDEDDMNDLLLDAWTEGIICWCNERSRDMELVQTQFYQKIRSTIFRYQLRLKARVQEKLGVSDFDSRAHKLEKQLEGEAEGTVIEVDFRNKKKRD